MASFFGEIIEPSTRAIFDDFSDEEETNVEPELQLSWVGGADKPPSVIDVFFIVQGRLSLAFAEAFLLSDNLEVAGEIIVGIRGCDEDNDNECKKSAALPSRIFIDKNTTICLVSPSVSPDITYYFCQTISSLLNIAKKIIILTNDSLYNYKTQYFQELPFAFIKQMNTSHGSDKYVVEPMETPNFIKGIPAGVISWCQIFKKDASAFVCYTDSEKLDSITANPYLLALKKISSNFIKNENLDMNKKAYYGKPQIIGGSSNIYM